MTQHTNKDTEIIVGIDNAINTREYEQCLLKQIKELKQNKKSLQDELKKCNKEKQVLLKRIYELECKLSPK